MSSLDLVSLSLFSSLQKFIEQEEGWTGMPENINSQPVSSTRLLWVQKLIFFFCCYESSRGSDDDHYLITSLHSDGLRTINGILWTVVSLLKDWIDRSTHTHSGVCTMMAWNYLPALFEWKSDLPSSTSSSLQKAIPHANFRNGSRITFWKEK